MIFMALGDEPGDAPLGTSRLAAEGGEGVAAGMIGMPHTGPGAICGNGSRAASAVAPRCTDPDEVEAHNRNDDKEEET